MQSSNPNDVYTAAIMTQEQIEQERVILRWVPTNGEREMLGGLCYYSEYILVRTAGGIGYTLFVQVEDDPREPREYWSVPLDNPHYMPVFWKVFQQWQAAMDKEREIEEGA